MQSSIWIARPPEDIWDYLVDVSNDTQWRKGVTDAKWVSDPPHGVGSTGLHVMEGIGNVPWKTTEWEEPRIMSWEFTSGRGKGVHGGYRVVPEDNGSRVTIHTRAKWPSLTKILILIMKRSLNRQNTADLEKLKAIMEA
jgi:uncharacterized membrane protein